MYRNTNEEKAYKIQPIKLVIENEEKLPLDPLSLNLAISNLSLHWVNNLPGYLTNIRQSLISDGLFLASIFGGDTLKELRDAFSIAETERSGGLSPHISPFAGLSDIGSVLTRAGFNLMTIDTELIRINYEDPLVLMHELQCMGEGNAVINRRNMTKELLYATCAAYQALYCNEDGSVPATFQIVYMIAWSPDPKQQQPKQRGSAQYSLKDLSKMTDKPLGLLEEEEEPKK